MNVYDSERMVDILKPYGYSLTEDQSEADLVILNTCHIREKAEQKMYSDLGRIRDKQQLRLQDGKKSAIIAVGGCVAQAEGAEIISQAPFVDLVFGPQTYHRLPELIARAVRSADKTKGKGRGVVDIDFPTESKFDTIPQSSEVRSSVFLSIQEGCDKFCTFCVVPYTRGAEYSRPVSDIVKEAKHLIQLGAKEITLLGQNVNAYHGVGSQGKEYGLGRLIRELADLDGLNRIRYTTSHPRDMDAELISAHRDVPQLMPFLHLPVQSGSDRILEAMNRKHTRDLYFKIIDQLREARSDIALSSDFIVGFPGETQKDFEDTLELIDRVFYAQVYSFKYSIRPGTPAGSLDSQIDEKEKADRLQKLQALVNQQQIDFNKQTIGKTIPVLFEKKGKMEGQLIGRSPYMQSVVVEAKERLIGQIVDVFVKEAHPNSISGTIVTSESVVHAKI